MNWWKKFSSKSTEDQIRLWSYAAWTLPFTALAMIVFSYWYDNAVFYSQIIWLISVVFFTVGVFWWWWALYKLLEIIKRLETTAHGLTSIKQAIRNLRDSLAKNNSNNRKRREPESD